MLNKQIAAALNVGEKMVKFHRAHIMEKFPRCARGARVPSAIAQSGDPSLSAHYERLQRPVLYDFAIPGAAFFGKFGSLYPAYIRGEEYLAAGRGPEAAAEFEKVLNHRGVVWTIARVAWRNMAD